MVDSVVVLVVASGEALAAGAAVSVFCSQAAKSAAPARMQMYFFIITKFGQMMIAARTHFGCAIYKGASYLSPWASATARHVSLPSRVLMPPISAGCFLHASSNPRSASNST